MNSPTQLHSHSFRQHMLGRYPPGRPLCGTAALTRILLRPNPAPRGLVDRTMEPAASNGKSRFPFQ